MSKPVIKKRYGKWVYAGYYDDRASKFVTRLNQRDTGYKDCHGCTIRNGDRLRGIITGNIIHVDEKFVSVCEYGTVLGKLKIIRPYRILGCNYEL